MGRTFNTTVGRASFPHLDKPNTFGKYAIVVLLPKDDVNAQKTVSEIYSALADEAKVQAGDKAAEVLSRCQALRDGDDKSKFKTWRAEYAGNYVLSASRRGDFGKPCVVNRHKQPIDALEVYAGCDVIVHVEVYGCGYSGVKHVNLGFQHVMKVNDNKPFTGGGVTAEDAFSDLDLPAESVPMGFNTTPVVAPGVNPLSTQVNNVVQNARAAVSMAQPAPLPTGQEPFNPFNQV